jgi:4'-phosphopantetheinyl transferase
MSQSRGDLLEIPNWLRPPAKVQLVEDEVHLWLVNLFRSSFKIGTCFALLNDAEKDQAQKFVFEKDRNRYTVAHAALRIILGQYLDRSPTALQFVQGPMSKPALGDNSYLRFNLSHSDHLILFVFSFGCEVGVDVETERGDRANQEIVRSCFSAKEQAEWNALDHDLQETAFYLGWTRKEAYLKARGDGLSGSLCDFDVSLTPGRPAVLVSRDANRWDMVSFRPEPGSVASVVMEGRNHKLCYFEWCEPPEL